jgi:hypothetical protein
MDRIEVFFDGYPVDISGYEMAFEFINPMFSENHFNTNYSFQHTLPWSAKNKARLQHANRIDTLRKSEYDYALVINGALFFEGSAKVQLTNFQRLNVTVVGYGIDFVKALEALQIDQLDLDSYNVYSESITDPSEKLAQWQSFITNRMNEDPTEGSHKFPSIQTFGYTGDNNSGNIYHQVHKNIVNPFAEGSFQRNWRISYTPGTNVTFNQWPFTVSPCPRIEYLIEKINERFNISNMTGEIFQELEFKQMWVFSGVVMDEVQRHEFMGVSYYSNIHGRVIDLKNYVPKCSALEIYNMLFEIFGALFTKSKGTLTAVTVKELMNRKPILMKSSSIDVSIEVQDYSDEFSVVYEDGVKNKWKSFLPFIYIPVAAADGVDNQWNGINEDIAEASNQIKLRHQVMKSTFFVIEGYAGGEVQFNSPTWSWRGNGEYSPRHQYFNGISAVSDDGQYRNEKLYVGLYRGRYTGFQWKFPNDTDPAVPTPVEQYWSYSHDQTLWDPTSTPLPFVHNFGKSIYLGMQNGTWENWLKYYFLNAELYDKLTINVSMPVHELMKFCKFRDIKHILQMKSGSVRGIHEKISGKITEFGVQDVSFTYRIPKDVLFQGDFSDDFSGDFNG